MRSATVRGGRRIGGRAASPRSARAPRDVISIGPSRSRRRGVSSTARVEPATSAAPAHLGNGVGKAVGVALVRRRERQIPGRCSQSQSPGAVIGHPGRALGTKGPAGVDDDHSGHRAASGPDGLRTRQEGDTVHVLARDPAQIGAAGERIVHREPIHHDEDFVGSATAKLRRRRRTASGAANGDTLPAIERAGQVAASYGELLARDRDRIRRGDDGHAVELERQR